MTAFEPDRSRLPHDACEHLCTKALYMASTDPDLIEENPEYAETASFWCALTQMPFGPDDEEASLETCRPHRPCCVSRAVPRA